MEAIAFGGGVNSVAMTIMLVEEGWRGRIVFADTGAEWPETYEYIDYFEREFLRPRGLSIVRLGAEWRRPDRAMSLIKYCEKHHIIPLAAVRWCTQEWKVIPMQRYCEEHGITRVLLGIAADEAHRSPGKPRPLVKRGITRDACVGIIRKAGLEVPRKSGCFICPFQPPVMWRELWQKHPELFELAMRLEETAQRSVEKKGKCWRVTFDPDGRFTLRELRRQAELQPPLFNIDVYYQPCMCRL